VSPKAHLEHRQALEVVAGDVLVGDADAAVQLDALLADEAHRLAQLHPRLAHARRRCVGGSPSLRLAK
jgi:regulator of RNase E activity RraA